MVLFCILFCIVTCYTTGKLQTSPRENYVQKYFLKLTESWENVAIFEKIKFSWHTVNITEYVLSMSPILATALIFPLPSTRQHPSYGDCLEVKREYYQYSSVLDCVTQCSQSAAHLHEQFLQVQQIGFFDTVGWVT